MSALNGASKPFEVNSRLAMIKDLHDTITKYSLFDHKCSLVTYTGINMDNMSFNRKTIELDPSHLFDKFLFSSHNSTHAKIQSKFIYSIQALELVSLKALLGCVVPSFEVGTFVNKNFNETKYYNSSGKLFSSVNKLIFLQKNLILI